MRPVSRRRLLKTGAVAGTVGAVVYLTHDRGGSDSAAPSVGPEVPYAELGDQMRQRVDASLDDMAMYLEGYNELDMGETVVRPHASDITFYEDPNGADADLITGVSTRLAAEGPYADLTAVPEGQRDRDALAQGLARTVYSPAGNLSDYHPTNASENDWKITHLSAGLLDQTDGYAAIHLDTDGFADLITAHEQAETDRKFTALQKFCYDLLLLADDADAAVFAERS